MPSRCRRFLVVLLVLTALTSGATMARDDRAARREGQPDSIGAATMLPSGTIVLDLRAEGPAVLYGSHITGYEWNGVHPEPKGNSFPFATIGCYQAIDAPLMISASNIRQQRRLWAALGRPEMAKQNNSQRLDAHTEEKAVLSEIIATRRAEEWEALLQAHRVPAGRIRRMQKVLADPQIPTRSLLRRHAPAMGLDRPVTMPVMAFRLEAVVELRH